MASNQVERIHLKLRELRELLGLTAGEFARKAGLKARTVALWEEELATPALKELRQIQNAFSVDLNWMLLDDYRPNYAAQVDVRNGKIEDPLLFRSGREPRDAAQFVSRYRALNPSDKAFVHKVFESMAELPATLDHPPVSSGALVRHKA